MGEKLFRMEDVKVTKHNICEHYGVIDTLVIVILIAFVGYYAAKVNGFLDFSGKYGIESLSASREVYNLELILDDENGTQWGMLEKAKSGDNLDIRFRKQVYISSIKLTCSVCPELNVYLYNDEIGNWQSCLYSDTDGVLELKDPISTDRVRLAVADGYDETNWGLQEINFSLGEAQE